MKLSFGSNDLQASSSFNQRKEYIQNYPAGIKEYRTIDFWYNDMLYGKISTNEDVIYPSEAFLSQLPGEDKDTHFALNFVVDAYVGFTQAMKRLENSNIFVSLDGTPFESRFQPTKGWANTSLIYRDYINSFYNGILLPFISKPGRTEDIKDFDGFIEEFTQLIDATSLSIPFTKTEYITSKYMSPLASGLVVEFADHKYGEDPDKIADFMNNVNFELYRDTARNYGFAIDKNAPWRMIANVGNNRMQGYMEKYEVGFEDLFEKYYFQSHLLDIPTMKSYIRQYYEMFRTDFPDVTVPAVETVEGRNISLTKTVPRAIMTDSEYESRFNNLFWIRLYIFIRAKETNRDWDQHKFDQTAKKASDFFIYSGELAMFKFVNKEVKREAGEYYQTDKYRRGTFRFKRKRG